MFVDVISRMLVLIYVSVVELKRRCDEEMALLRGDGDSPVLPGEEVCIMSFSTP